MLNQYAAIAEILGVILVIASLVYVARQLKQTTEMMRVGAANERVRREYEILDTLIENREVAEIWFKGGTDFDSLDEVDKQRLIFFERRAIVLWHHLFSLYQQGLFPEADRHWNEWVIQNIGRRQAIRESWQLFKESYEKPFQDYIDGQFAIADSAAS
jgi:hypothetical protein